MLGGIIQPVTYPSGDHWIIDPKPPEFKPDKAYYVSLRKRYEERGQYDLDTEEIEYRKRYEEFMRKHMRESD